MNEPRPLLQRAPFPPVLLLLMAFASGVLCDRAGWLPGRGDQPPGTRTTFAPFWEAWRKVKEYYVDRTKVDDRAMTQGAIAGMLRSLGDEGHTTYLTKEERERATEDLGGQMQGIGVRLALRQGKPTIIQTIPNSPARESGIRPGDVLAQVDDQPTATLTFAQISSRVRGPAGTEVKLRIDRPGEKEPLDMTVKRGKVEVPEVSWQILPGQPALALVSLQRFSKNSGRQMKEALEQIQAKGVSGLILDVRGNAGGYKDQCVEVASQFLPEGKVLFIQQDARGNRESITAVKGGICTTLPMCVLIDRGTASSSEILVGALQDHHRAQVVGTRTYGTGTVLREYPLSDGSAVRLAVYQWLTPLRREIWHKGIQPDSGLEVALPADGSALLPDQETPLTEADLKKSGDAQLLKGIAVLRERLPAPAGGK